MPSHRWLTLLAVVALVACAPAPVTVTSTATEPPVVPPTLTPEPAPTSTPSPLVLRLWVAPAFAPDPQSEAGALLLQHIQDFESEHDNLHVEIRLKDERGMSGLLETLRAASHVAPAGVPDLITLEASDLAEAARAGLVTALPPLEEQAAADGYAQLATSVDGVRYGAPFGSRADVLVFRAEDLGPAPRSWADLLSSTPPFLFPAGDPEAQTTLAQYLSQGVGLTNPDGRYALDPIALEEVLAFYGSAHNAGLLPLTVRQYETSLETWGAFHEGRSTSAVAPLHVFLAEGRANESAAPLPTRDGTGTCLTSTWAWALVAAEPRRQAAATELMNWLTEPGFLGEWTQALGLLPPDSASLDAWADGPEKSLATQLSTVAAPLPPAELRAAVGAAIRSAIDSVLSGQLTPSAAAMAAIQALPQP
ncbi:MAG TPA: extracellular solute-binding protein [Anaerolineales bacterium]|nr:extracellular solute-binding protein [Anaerolineales bacterium]